MMDVAKKIAIIRHVGVKKTKLLSSPLEDNSDKTDSGNSVTEASSEVSTEASSEVSTEASSEVSTEASSEVSTEEGAVTIPKEELDKKVDT
jgi:small subunit ribosomal protein S3Ae